jgi:hypothetical protein
MSHGQMVKKPSRLAEEARGSTPDSGKHPCENILKSRPKSWASVNPEYRKWVGGAPLPALHCRPFHVRVEDPTKVTRALVGRPAAETP